MQYTWCVILPRATTVAQLTVACLYIIKQLIQEHGTLDHTEMRLQSIHADRLINDIYRPHVCQIYLGCAESEAVAHTTLR